jgi:L-alanine-DL-glutamate epimerase-like enolase superfamily enzyme
MRLEELEVVPYSLPFRDPYVTARGELNERELILVRIRGEGLEGLGETASLALRGGAGIDRIAAEIRGRCWPALLDGGVDPERIWSAIARCRNRDASAEALAAVDIALHDLVGRASGKPVWRLLGAEQANPVVCNATLPAANPSETRRMAEQWRAQGFRTFKLKVGLPGDVTQVATVRQALGTEIDIRVDANGAWSVDDAAERLPALANHDIELAEQPVGTFEQMVELRRRVDVRIAADESLVSPFDARRAAAAHAVQALRYRGGDAGVAHGLATERMFSATVGSGVKAEEDRLLVDERPGLGVELDEDALAARRLD